jgi:predicted DNA-binding transcriptional regulator AlpA
MSQHRLLTFPQLKSEKGIPFSRQYVNELIRRGIFPGSVKTPGGGQVNLWIEEEIDAYIESMRQARDTAPPDEAAARHAARMVAARAAKKNRKPSTVVIQRRKPTIKQTGPKTRLVKFCPN